MQDSDLIEYKTMVTTIKAIYEDGVLKPLEPLDLPDKQVVELQVEVQQPRNIVKLGGSWAQYVSGDSLSFEEIEALTHDQHSKSIERTLRQIEGDFSEDQPSD